MVKNKNILYILFIIILLIGAVVLFLNSGTKVEHKFKKECDYYDTQEFSVDGKEYISEVCVNYEK